VPFTAGAKAALERALGQADALGHAAVAPAHLLLALADEPEAVLAAGATPETMRAAALRRLAASPPPARQRFDLDTTIAGGGAVPVWLGDHELPIGDLGHPRTDATVLRAMLAKDGGGAELLRAHGIDEATVGGELGTS
jgi:ATP-dependent Clp protease ATP-binding subunit ClpA